MIQCCRMVECWNEAVIDWMDVGKNIDGSTVEVCLAKPVEKGNIVRWTRSPGNGKLSPAVSCNFLTKFNTLFSCSFFYSSFATFLRFSEFDGANSSPFLSPPLSLRSFPNPLPSFFLLFPFLSLPSPFLSPHLKHIIRFTLCMDTDHTLPSDSIITGHLFRRGGYRLKEKERKREICRK